VRRSVYCTASFSVCSRRRTELPIIYADFRLDYKLATLPFLKRLSKSSFLDLAEIHSTGLNEKKWLVLNGPLTLVSRKLGHEKNRSDHKAF
jgi:hypothetical protein